RSAGRVLARVRDEADRDRRARETGRAAHLRRCRRLVRVSEAIVETLQGRDRPGSRLGLARRGGLRARADGRDRRRLVGEALSARRLHQDAEPSQGGRAIRGGEGEGGRREERREAKAQAHDAEVTAFRPALVARLALAYFASVFFIGFVLGVIRTLWIAPRLGEHVAELVEMPVMVAASFLVARVL